jgi:UDP-2,3-diacylglucosamine hydrolase
MTILFISDLHLTGQRPQITELFLRFLHERCESAAALYILGDLFEYWVGDEMLDMDEFREIGGALKRLTHTGVPVYLTHGNRDFLIGAEFCQRTAVKLLEQPSVIDLHGRPTLILHGDSLCTDDAEHQAWRKQVLDPRWQQDFLSKSLAERIRIAARLRQQSEEHKQHKPMQIMDVNQDAVESLMRAYQVRFMIHGHTHRPGQHDFPLDEQTASRIVLGDWYQQGSVLSCDPDSWRLDTLPLN